MRQSLKSSRVLLVLALVLGAFVTAHGATVNDVDITDAVEDELLLDKGVRSQLIDVETTNGVVVLSGDVDNLLDKERAARVARTVRGVRSVVNRIRVDPPFSHPDSTIRKEVNSALLTNPATESYEIDVSVDNGSVTLGGQVESWQERELAEIVAKGVRGVREVRNEVTVKLAAVRPDHEIQNEIESALQWNVLVDDGLVTVTVDDGEVTLSGIVGSAAERVEALGEAWVAGVSSVDASDLTVARWARDEELRGSKYVLKPDKEVQDAVRAALLRDPRVNSAGITAGVDNGVATLRGTVDSLATKRAAGQDARNTVGVVAVNNRLKVRWSGSLTNAEIVAAVEDAIERDPYLEKYEMDVDVIGGVAYLAGMVDSAFEKSQAERVAAHVKGVVAVENNLKVSDVDPVIYDPYVDPVYVYDYEWVWEDYKPPVYSFTDDLEIRDEIKDELFWSPFVDADEVDVTVEDGVATLRGTVDSWAEKDAATENAFDGGAVWVDNDLNVRYLDQLEDRTP